MRECCSVKMANWCPLTNWMAQPLFCPCHLSEGGLCKCGCWIIGQWEEMWASLRGTENANNTVCRLRLVSPRVLQAEARHTPAVDAFRRISFYRQWVGLDGLVISFQLFDSMKIVNKGSWCILDSPGTSSGHIFTTSPVNAELEAWMEILHISSWINKHFLFLSNLLRLGDWKQALLQETGSA